jgi:hypothetical protein
LNPGAALGIWRPAGERGAELVVIFRDTMPRELAESPGTATFVMTVEVDDTGDGMTFDGELVVRSAEGYPIVTIPGATWMATRVTFDRNPASPETEVTPP